GRLLLWHGAPGTGKTSAVKALAWEWREWCEGHCVVDPESLLGGMPTYLMHVLDGLAEEIEDGDEKWRLLLLEGTGELLAPGPNGCGSMGCPRRAIRRAPCPSRSSTRCSSAVRSKRGPR